jgi:hypothetical protein
MRLYSIIGFAVLAVVLVTLIGTVLWLWPDSDLAIPPPHAADCLGGCAAGAGVRNRVPRRGPRRMPPHRSALRNLALAANLRERRLAPCSDSRFAMCCG